VVRRRVRRENVFKILPQLKPETVAMEACGGAHHLCRLLRGAGFEVRLMSPGALQRRARVDRSRAQTT
jgi:transposase